MSDWLWAVTALSIVAVILWFGAGCSPRQVPIQLTMERVAERWYLPDIWNEAKHPPTVDPSLYPPRSLTPWPTKTSTGTDTPTPTATALPTPTKTRIPWPEGEVPAEVPYEVWLNLLEKTRRARHVEAWIDVFEDRLIIIAGNNDLGAQISPIVEHEGEDGRLYRAMEICEGLLIEMPEGGWVWLVRGYTGPIERIVTYDEPSTLP